MRKKFLTVQPQRHKLLPTGLLVAGGKVMACNQVINYIMQPSEKLSHLVRANVSYNVHTDLPDCSLL